MTLEKWIALYNRKNPLDPYIPDKRFVLFFDKNKGFCEVRYEKDMAFIGQLCGDLRYFKEVIDRAASEADIHCAGTIFIRGNARAVLRLLGYKVTEVDEQGGLERYHAIHKNTGKWGLVTPAWRYDDTGVQAYYCTWEI